MSLIGILDQKLDAPRAKRYETTVLWKPLFLLFFSFGLGWSQTTEEIHIEVVDRGHPVTVLAPHGGFIEPGTTELARRFSKGTWNHYSFMGLQPTANHQLHVSSHLFSEPSALRIVQKSKLCISLHGFSGKHHTPLCLGGRNTLLKRNFGELLVAQGFLTADQVKPCPGLEGQHPENIVNRCQHQGLQLEFSAGFRHKLLGDKAELEKFTAALHLAVQQSLESLDQCVDLFH